jgi:hypothetical protein
MRILGVKKRTHLTHFKANLNPIKAILTRFERDQKPLEANPSHAKAGRTSASQKAAKGGWRA